MSDETALSQQLCCVQQLGMLGCIKTNLVYCWVHPDSTIFFVDCKCRYPCTEPKRKTWQQSSASWLLLLLFFIRRSSSPWIGLLLQPWIDPCKYPCFDHCTSFALAFEDFIVHRDLHRGRTCTSSAQLSLRSNLQWSIATIIAIKLFHSQDSSRLTNVFMRPSSQLTGSFVPTRCSSRLDRAVMFYVASRQAHRSWLKIVVGRLEHSRATTFFETSRNSASRGEFFSPANLKRGCERGSWLGWLTAFTDLKRGW